MYSRANSLIGYIGGGRVGGLSLKERIQRKLQTNANVLREFLLWFYIDDGAAEVGLSC